MTSSRIASRHRQAPLVVEIVVLGLLVVTDLVITWLQPLPDSSELQAAAFSGLAPAVGAAVAVVAVLRRRFDRLALLTGLVAGASLLVSAVSGAAALAGSPVQAQSPLAEGLALALLAGAVCHRLPPRSVVPLALLAAVAATAAAPLRFGFGSPWALLAVPAALLWGGSVATGLILRDAETRYDARLLKAKETERLTLARELHDFVAHHVSGIVVLAQGARFAAEQATAAGRPVPAADGVYAEIERAGGESLTAMRRLVGMLRTEEASGRDADPAGLRAELTEVCGDDPRIRLTVPAELDQLSLPPALVVAAHRIVLEAVTNARRYAVPGTPVEVHAALRRRGFTAWLVLQVDNTAAEGAGRGEGFGLIGMAERAQGLGGTVTSGPDGAVDGSPGTRRWRVRAELPVDPAPAHLFRARPAEPSPGPGPTLRGEGDGR